MTEASTNHGLNAQLTLDELRADVASGAIDTVIVAFTDSLGRLQGKRCGARSFLEDVLEHGAEGCNYLLAVDVEMNTIDGYAMSSWETGYGDIDDAARCVDPAQSPVAAGTALVLCDLMWSDKSPVVAPRARSCAPRWNGSKNSVAAPTWARSSNYCVRRLLPGGLAEGLPRAGCRGPSTTWTTRCSPRPASNRSSGRSATT